MELTAGFGTLGKLPLELRCAIYNYAMPWMDRSFRHFSIARTSRCIYREVSSRLYDHCDIIFTPVYNVLVDLSTIHVRLSDRQGTDLMTLPSLKQGHRWEISGAYDNISLVSFRHVRVEVYGNPNVDAGGVINEREGIKLIVSFLCGARKTPNQEFQGKRPSESTTSHANGLTKTLKAVTISLAGSWIHNGDVIAALPDIFPACNGGDLGLLIGPFGQLIENNAGGDPPIIWLAIPARILSRVAPNWARNVSQQTSVVRQTRKGDTLNETHGGPLLKDKTGLQRTEAELDFWLDRLDGKNADLLREWRWTK